MSIFKKRNSNESGMASTYAFEGSMMMDREEFDEAIVTLEKSLSLNKRQHDVLHNLGVCYFKKTLKAIMERGGNNPPDAYENLDKAESYFIKALKLKPNYPTAANNLAKLREYKNNWL